MFMQHLEADARTRRFPGIFVGGEKKLGIANLVNIYTGI